LGGLRYRGQQREHIYLPEVDYAQRCGQVNNPALANGPHIRTLEWKQMLPREYAERMRGTVLTRETTITPAGADQYEYRFPDEQNARLYQEYRARAEQIPGLNV
jgi:UDP-galactopyranose mutase